MKQESLRIMSRDITGNEKYLYMYSPEIKFFFEMDKNSLEMRCLRTTLENCIQDYDCCKFYKGRLYANEISGIHLIEYDIEKEIVKKIELGFTEWKDQNVSEIVFDEGRVFVLGKRTKQALIWNIDEGESNRIIYPKEVSDYTYVISCKTQDEIVVFPPSGCYCYIYNTKNSDWERIHCKEELMNPARAYVKNAIIYILEKKGLLVFNTMTRKIQRVILNSLNIGYYAGMVLTKDDIILLRGDNGSIEYYNRLSFEIEKVVDNQRENIVERDRLDYGRYYGFFEDDQYCYFANRVYDSFMKISKYDGNVIWYNPRPIDEEKMIIYSIKSGRNCYEKMDSTLNNFFKALVET